VTGKGPYKMNMIVSVAFELVKNNLFCDRVYFLLLSLTVSVGITRGMLHM